MSESQKKVVEEYRFFSKPLLKKANEAAHREKRNRCINPEKIEKLPLDFIYYVIGFLYHKKNELRLRILVDENGNFEFIDVSVTRYYSLPLIQFFDDDTCNIKQGERPYPNGREWQESEVKKPLRKQSKFRKLVLSNYSNTCALCEINEPSLLRAAHIWDVKDGGPDTEENGICLCINHETGFDKGLIKINPNYSVEASNGIGVTVNKLKLPSNKKKYPLPKYLKKKLLNLK